MDVLVDIYCKLRPYQHELKNQRNRISYVHKKLVEPIIFYFHRKPKWNLRFEAEFRENMTLKV